FFQYLFSKSTSPSQRAALNRVLGFYQQFRAHFQQNMRLTYNLRRYHKIKYRINTHIICVYIFFKKNTPSWLIQNPGGYRRRPDFRFASF
ncbi:unnamed protein product, partial [Oikopleura dioica]